MQRFEIFLKVCEFFIKCELDPKYINKIDDQLEKPHSKKDVFLLVKHIKSFHNMRKTLCQKILKRLPTNNIVSELASARGITQYNSCPNGSKCAISGVLLKPDTGILIILDETTLITFHIRYKIVLYHFWTLVHFPNEIGLGAKQWLKNQPFWNTGKIKSIDNCTQKIIHYNDQQFPKSMYVKLKAISEYIDTKLPNIPINKN